MGPGGEVGGDGEEEEDLGGEGRRGAGAARKGGARPGRRQRTRGGTSPEHACGPGGSDKEGARRYRSRRRRV